MMNKHKLIKDADGIDFTKEYQQTFVAFLDRKLGRKATDIEILEAYWNDAITEEWIAEAHRIRDEIHD